MNVHPLQPPQPMSRGIRPGRRGFTLIELLIVIAIILILIAIALPNFLEAQIRARVTKVKGEMRSVATALEAYQTGWRKYPWGAEFPNLGFPAFPPAEPFDLHLPAILTTPVAFLSQLPPDSFNNLFHEGSDLGDISVPFHYSEEETNERLGEPDLFLELTEFLFFQRRNVKYFILSHGPDGDHDEPGDQHEPASHDGEEEGGPAIYSPTNGTKSNGDIYYFGPGFGFS